MKRTKERFGKLEMYNNHGISGCKVFDGEDLEYQDRYRLQQAQQKAWIEQQKYEHNLKNQEEMEEERKYAEQTLAINRMRSMLEAEHEQRRRDMKVTDKYVFFWGGPFSNFAPVEEGIEFDGFRFPTSEHVFMYIKAKTFNDDEIAEKIKNALDPKTAKKLGRKVRG